MSLIVQKNQVNNIYVTVSEKTVLSPAYYLMSLFSNENKDAKVIRFSGDNSVNQIRWNQFTLEEVDAQYEDLENAKINLLAGDSYDYVIYQTSATTGTSIVNLTSVESGLLQVESTTISPNIFNTTKTILTFK